MKRPEYYKENGCDIATNDPYDTFSGIWETTEGHPCRGCPFRLICNLLNKLNSESTSPKQSNPQSRTMKDGVTNADIAKVMNITKRQASKLRAEGKVNLEDIKLRMNPKGM